MSAPHKSLDCLPSLCQKLSDLVEVWHSYNKNNFACFFLRHSIVHCVSKKNKQNYLPVHDASYITSQVPRITMTKC